MRKIVSITELDLLEGYIDDDAFERLHANRHACYESEDGVYLLAFYYCDVKKPDQRDEKLYIYCSAKELLFFGDNQHCIQLMNSIDERLVPYQQLLEFFLALTAEDVFELEQSEDEITSLEESLLTNKRLDVDSSVKIIAIRRELLKIKRYYEQLSVVTGELSENKNETLPTGLQKRFTYLDHRIDRLQSSVLHLREYITQVREAYQAQTDIEQNQIMKVFTVITSIFLPLTLIAGWYGMNIRMPEYGWKFGYLYVGILSILVCAACFAIFKKRKWF